MTSWEDKRAHQLARLDRMELHIQETAEPGTADTYDRLARIDELRELTLERSPAEWEASPDLPERPVFQVPKAGANQEPSD